MKKIIFVLILLNFLLTTTVFATKEEVNFRLNRVAESAKYNRAQAGTEQLPVLIGNIIQYTLSFLGVIFLVLLVYAGFLWMTAQGESDQVTKAKDIMSNAIVGLIIVLMSYAITFYVVDKLSNTTLNNQSSTPTNQYGATP